MLGIALPRFMNRGLIEAADNSALGNSAPALPRFMNRGLIEARVTGTKLGIGRNFPDS